MDNKLSILVDGDTPGNNCILNAMVYLVQNRYVSENISSYSFLSNTDLYINSMREVIKLHFDIIEVSVDVSICDILIDIDDDYDMKFSNGDIINYPINIVINFSNNKDKGRYLMKRALSNNIALLNYEHTTQYNIADLLNFEVNNDYNSVNKLIIRFIMNKFNKLIHVHIEIIDIHGYNIIDDKFNADLYDILSTNINNNNHDKNTIGLVMDYLGLMGKRLLDNNINIEFPDNELSVNNININSLLDIKINYKGKDINEY